MANALGEFLGGVASAIRDMTGDPPEVKMKPVDFADKIRSIETGKDVSGVTATAGDVLKGKVFVNSEGNEVEGTIPVKDRVAYALTPDNNSMTMPRGYYPDDTVTVKATVSATKAIMPTKEQQQITSHDYFLSSVIVAPIPDEYQDVSKVTAAAEDVRKGKVFVDTAGNEIVGTLVPEIVDVTVDEIWAGSGTSNSLVGSGIIRYVTFMNHDGTVEYGRKSVIRGENCVDPVTGGFLDTPTKESTVQYNYTFVGWATEPNGGLNSNALKNVTEDRTVYANFASVLRYYTITFYDSDGTTVLATKSVAYGSVPSYTAEKEGLVFEGWNPEPVSVTGDASYQAVWSENITFASATWADIARISREGKATQYFKIGDTRDITYTAPNGTVVTTAVKIIGFDHDETEDGTKVGITVFTELAGFCAALNSSKVTYEGVKQYYAGGWYNCNLRNVLNSTVFNSLDDDLKAVIKQVKKESSYYTTAQAAGEIISYDKLWLMSAAESGRSSSSHGIPGGDGTAYSLRDSVKKDPNGSAIDWWLRSGVNKNYLYAAYINSSGTLRTDTAATASVFVAFGFCI